MDFTNLKAFMDHMAAERTAEQYTFVPAVCFMPSTP